LHGSQRTSPPWPEQHFKANKGFIGESKENMNQAGNALFLLKHFS